MFNILNENGLHIGRIKVNSHICCCSEKCVYYNKNERVIEMNATEGYSDLIKRIKDGFMEINNNIIVDLQKQDDSYLTLCNRLEIWKSNIRLY